VLVAALQSSLLALVLSFYPRVIYESYARAARVSSLLPLEDQARGAAPADSFLAEADCLVVGIGMTDPPQGVDNS